MDLSIYEFDIRALNSLHFSAFSGPSFRGGFGSVLRQLACVTGMSDCGSCPVLRECPFTQLFNCAAPEGDQHFSKELQVPRPFIIDAPEQREASQGQHMRFRLALSGRSAQLLSYVVLAFRQLGLVGIGRGRGRYELVSVTCIDPLNRRLPCQVYDGNQNRMYANNSFSIAFSTVTDQYASLQVRKLKVHFRSPTHLKAGGRAVHEPPEFEHMLRAVLRRYSDLSALYGEKRPNLDYRQLIELSKEIQLTASNLNYFRQQGFSQRKGEETPTEGITGSVIYEGDLTPFMPYLIYGQWLHIGKQATFGMGKYDLETAG